MTGGRAVVELTSMFTLDQVVPWGRSFEEYRRMFALSETDLTRRIVGCGDGPAAFNAEATRRGVRVVSCDPIYAFTAAQIERRIADASPQVLEQTRLNASSFVWSEAVPSIDALRKLRMDAMRDFLDDFAAGQQAGRYVEAALPTLPFLNGAFDLALCSHLLFLYSEHVDELFHLAALREMCRIAQEVRVFPLLTLTGERSAYVNGCLAAMRDAGHHAAIEQVPYEFQRGGNQMLRIGRQS